jgi:hypothetical protein
MCASKFDAVGNDVRYNGADPLFRYVTLTPKLLSIMIIMQTKYTWHGQESICTELCFQISLHPSSFLLFLVTQSVRSHEQLSHVRARRPEFGFRKRHRSQNSSRLHWFSCTMRTGLSIGVRADGVRLCLWTAATNRPRRCMRMENRSGMISAENRITGRETCPSDISHHKCYMDWPGREHEPKLWEAGD